MRVSETLLMKLFCHLFFACCTCWVHVIFDWAIYSFRFLNTSSFFEFW
jgi:hypothetical protein